MSPEEIKETQRKQNVMQAAIEGKKIESKGEQGDWVPNAIPSWNWYNFDYRAKPQEPRRLKMTASESGNLLFDFKFDELPVPHSHIEFIELTPDIRAKLNL